MTSVRYALATHTTNNNCLGEDKTLEDELRAALELATEEEIEQLTQVLFARKYNPLDYFQTPLPLEVQSLDWNIRLDYLEERFRYLAADGLTVLRGKSQEVSYRQTLIKVCHFLKISYSQSLSATEIEAEIFLYLMSRAWQSLPADEQKSLNAKIVRSLANSNSPEPLPVHLQHDPLNLFLKGSGTIAISSLIKPWLVKHISHQFTLHFATYQAAKTALFGGGAAQLPSYLALQTAARYGAARTMLAFVGPVLWGCFLADLGWRAISTNYTRIIPTIFALAQIRLTRSECWQPAY